MLVAACWLPLLVFAKQHVQWILWGYLNPRLFELEAKNENWLSTLSHLGWSLWTPKNPLRFSFKETDSSGRSSKKPSGTALFLVGTLLTLVYFLMWCDAPLVMTRNTLWCPPRPNPSSDGSYTKCDIFLLMNWHLGGASQHTLMAYWPSIKLVRHVYMNS